MAQSGPSFLTDPLFDSVFAAVNPSLFDTRLKSATYDLAFSPLLQDMIQVACPETQDSTKTEKIDGVTYNDLYNSLLSSFPVNISKVSINAHRYYVDNLSPNIRTNMEMNGYISHK